MQQNILLPVALCWLFLLCLWSCADKRKPENKSAKRDSAGIEQVLSENQQSDTIREEVVEFYRKRNFQPAWTEEGKLNSKGRSLTTLFQQMDEYGIPRANVPGAEFGDELSRNSAATTDVLFTSSFFKYYPQLHSGILDPHSLEEIDWNIEARPKPDFVEVLDSLLSSSESDVFQKLEFHREFRELQKTLKLYQEIESRGGWPLVIVGDKGKLLKGDSGAVIRDLSERLLATGDLEEVSLESLFTPELQEAVKTFQQRHGLIADGVVGGETLKALNVTVSEKIKKIVLNMERWRWIPMHHLNGNYVLINIPEYKLRIYEEDKVKEEMKIVVGKDSAATNVFNDVIQKIVLNPYWNIPTSIAVAEILPQVQKDVDYLRENELEVGINWKFDTLKADTIEWDKLSEDNFPYTLRRKPGEANPLGQIKFIFPNRYAIYLHDTPASGLFEEQERGFSHGCIRLEKPLALAEFLLEPKQDMTMRKLQRQLKKRKQEEEVILSEPVPVYMLYFTAWVDEQGRVNFRDDVYGHDEVLENLLLGQAQ